MKIMNKEVAPLCNTFLRVLDVIACMFNILDDTILVFFLVVAKVIFYNHTVPKIRFLL